MRKDRFVKSLLAALLPGALVAASSVFSVAPATASAQAKRSAPKSQTKFRRVQVTASDIARLPRGEHYVIKLGDDTRTRAGGFSGSTPVNGGVLNSNGQGGNSGLTRSGAGRPALSDNNTVYEFRSERPIDFSRVLVQAGTDTRLVPLETWLRNHRPARGMKGWPFKRLLIGPAEGIAEIEGWKIKDAVPGTEYKCEVGDEDDNYCGCSSYLDCVHLVITGNCSSPLSCGDGECYCDAN